MGCTDLIKNSSFFHLKIHPYLSVIIHKITNKGRNLNIANVYFLVKVFHLIRPNRNSLI